MHAKCCYPRETSCISYHAYIKMLRVYRFFWDRMVKITFIRRLIWRLKLLDLLDLLLSRILLFLLLSSCSFLGYQSCERTRLCRLRWLWNRSRFYPSISSLFQLSSDSPLYRGYLQVVSELFISCYVKYSAVLSGLLLRVRILDINNNIRKEAESRGL